MNNQEIQDILDQHAQALRGLGEASTAFDRAIAGMRDVLQAIADASHQQGAAINTVVAANQAALKMLRG